MQWAHLNSDPLCYNRTNWCQETIAKCSQWPSNYLHPLRWRRVAKQLRPCSKQPLIRSLIVRVWLRYPGLWRAVSEQVMSRVRPRVWQLCMWQIHPATSVIQQPLRSNLKNRRPLKVVVNEGMRFGVIWHALHSITLESVQSVWV